MNKKFDIFIVTQLGLSQIAKDEFIDKTSALGINYASVNEESSGLSVMQISIADACLLHFYLKIPTRILLRIDSFKARDLPKLFNKTKKIDFNNYFIQNELEFNITATSSKLFDSRKIENTMKEAIAYYQQANAVKKKLKDSLKTQSVSLYVRVLNDIFTISLDLTGDRLDQRGNKLESVKAPIRATIASAAYFFAVKNDCNINSLYDPMCGSGTLLIESALFNTPLNRSFAFEDYFLTKDFKIDYQQLKPLHEHQIGLTLSDLSEDNINKVTKNLETSQLIDHIQSIKVEDIFNISSFEDKTVFINPPYNIRIKTKKNFFTNLLDHLKNHQCKRAIIISPNIVGKNKAQKVKTLGPINNGGIKVYISDLFFKD